MLSFHPKNLIISCFTGEQAGTKRDNLTVDATTNRLNSLLFKVKPELSDGDLQLCWHPNIKQFLFWAGEISSHEWLLCIEPLWNCMWEAWSILWTRLWGSLVWFTIMPVNCCSGRQMIDICFSLPQGCGRWCCDCYRSWRICVWSVSDLILSFWSFTNEFELEI